MVQLRQFVGHFCPRDQSRLGMMMMLALAIVSSRCMQAQQNGPPVSTFTQPSSISSLPQLPASAAQDAADCEKTIHDAFHNLDQLALVEAAIANADHLLQIRTTFQGANWWQTVDAREDSADLHRVAALDNEQRLTLAKAEQTIASIKVDGSLSEKQTAEALAKLSAASKIERQILGDESRWYAQTLVLMGSLASAQRHTTEAEADYSQALDIRHKTLGETHPLYAEVLLAQARLCSSTDRYAQAEPLYKQALEIQKTTLSEQNKQYATTLDELATLYVSMGRNSQAEVLYQQALDIEKKTVGEHHPLYATSLCNLGDLYRYMGRYTQAEPLYVQSLSIRKQTLGEEHPDYARSLDRLAALYDSMGRYAQAEPLYKQAITIRAKALDQEHPDYARSLNNLGLLYKEMGRYQEAEPLYLQALAIRKKVFGEQHRTYASSLDDLAQLYQAMGKYQQAERLYQQALAIRKKTLGEQHPAYAVNLDNLASLYEAMARYDEAETLTLQALEIRKKAVGEQHPGYAHNLIDLAELYQTMGRYGQAEDLYKQAVAIQQKVLGENTSEYATTEDALATLYVSMGRNQQAEVLYKQALDIEKKTVGEQHPLYATSLCNLGDLYRYMGRYSQAEPLYTQSLNIRKQVLGEEHPDYARSLDREAALYDSMGRYTQAEPLYKQAIAIRAKALGEEHPDYARSLNNLGLLYKEMGRYQDAEPLYQQALAIRKKVFGEQHRTYASSLDDLAQLYQAMGKYPQAEGLYQQALAIRKKTLGEQHPAYAVNLDNLSLLYKAMNRYDLAETLSRQALAIRKQTLGEYNPQYATNLKHLAAILVVEGHAQEASQLLLQSAQLQWLHLTENFPTMSDQQKRQFLSHSRFVQSEELSTLVFQGKGVDPKDGLRGALLGKNLLFEAARHESGAMNLAVSAASPEWKTKWREREKLRHEYAALVLQLMSSDSSHSQTPGHKAADPAYAHALAENIEQLEAELRQSNPAYAVSARVREVKLEDVVQALRPGEVLAEYVCYQPYDFAAWKQGAPRYGVFLLFGGTGQVTAIELGDAKTIDAAAKTFRDGMRAAIAEFKPVKPSVGQVRHSTEQIAESSSALRELVWQPLEKHLAGIHRVYVAPDGQLSLIPLEALASKDTSGNWRYLTEDWELIYLGTGRDLSRLAETAPKAWARSQRSAVLIGDPAFNAKPEDLAAMEARQISPDSVGLGAASSSPDAHGDDDAPRLEIPRNWNQVDVLAKLIAQASEQLEHFGWSVTTWVDRSAVKEWVESVEDPHILQFATHGYILDRPNNDPQGWDNPLLRSMLIMAGVNDWHPVYRVGSTFLSEADARAQGLTDEQLQAARVQLSDGVLTAYEVTGMHLQGTELVNLTACETGLGEVTPNGVAGLRQGFLLAGARSLTMSMWEVPAQDTTDEIRDFYQRWLGDPVKGQPPQRRYEAFHAAQLAALEHARQSYGAAHPFYWAGTIFVGDPGDLPSTQERSVTAKK
jgi:tetratricopeptide (TPR) repeat protein/CHAT domain-containing protein